ncbi:pyrin isoform X3 [Petaurus breviceps papuanus]|uniref:pyrin isoform X3 n=1 Tax=Petaurus breviceps papuanus TaxID=3040969 RepID=UPI0036DE5563
MAKTLSDHLLHTLESLVTYDLERFKFKLQNVNLDKDRDRIPQGRLQNAVGPVELAALLINSYGEKYAVKLTLQVLRAINQNLLLEELSKATNTECLTQKCVTEISGTSVFSRDTVSKSLIIENPDADLQDPNKVGTVGLQVPIPSIQVYPGQECQKKSQEEWEAQRTLKGSHLTEVLERQRNQSMNVPPKRTQLRVRIISSGDKELSSPEAAMIFEDKRDGILETTVPLKTAEARNAALVPESSRYENSEVAVTLGQKANRNQKLFFLGEKGIEKQGLHTSLGEQNHPNKNSADNCQDPGSQEEKRPGNMDTSMSSGKKEPKDPGNQYLKEACEDELTLSKTPIKAFNFMKITGAPVRAVSLRRMQESCSICQDMVEKASRNSCRHDIRYHRNVGYNVCLKCQAMFPKNFQHSKSLGNISTDFQEPMLSPGSTPYCEYHPKQLQLLFCKDHGKTICLNCSMSLDHKGHRILSIEEAAQSYKEQLQSHLEHLKKVREIAEEKKSQGNETMAAFLLSLPLLRGWECSASTSLENPKKILAFLLYQKRSLIFFFFFYGVFTVPYCKICVRYLVIGSLSSVGLGVSSVASTELPQNSHLISYVDLQYIKTSMGQLGGAVNKALALESGEPEFKSGLRHLILTSCVTLGKSLNPNCPALPSPKSKKTKQNKNLNRESLNVEEITVYYQQVDRSFRRVK